jgi:hypothetical protein
MTYATYYIHPETLIVCFKNFYKKYDIALKNFKDDAENFIKNNKNINNIEYVNKYDEIEKKDDGYYLKFSDEFPNRIDIYEKNTKNVGYIFNSYLTEIKKIFVFSLLELSSLPNEINIEYTKKETPKTIIPKIQLSYLDELKDSLSNGKILLKKTNKKKIE